MTTVSHPNNRRRSGGSSPLKIMFLLTFAVVTIIGAIVYLRALSFVSGGLDLQMEYQQKMMSLLSSEEGGSSSRSSSSSVRQKRKKQHVSSSLRGEENHQTDFIEYDDEGEIEEEEPILSSLPPVSNPIKTTNNHKPPPTPPWHLVSDPDDSFERNYIPLLDLYKYKNLRNLSKDVNKGAGIKHFFNPMCRHYRFDESKLPTVSVIMTTQNEPDDWISISVESILARTPPNLLVDIIVVDDNGIPGKHGLPDNIRRNVDESEFEYIKSLSPKVSVIKHENREGCARSRLSGARAAKGEVLMFVDSHIEMLSATWYHHLAVPIVENPSTIAMQTIDVIDDLGTKDYGNGAGPLQYGVINNE